MHSMQPIIGNLSQIQHTVRATGGLKWQHSANCHITQYFELIDYTTYIAATVWGVLLHQEQASPNLNMDFVGYVQYRTFHCLEGSKTTVKFVILDL